MGLGDLIFRGGHEQANNVANILVGQFGGRGEVGIQDIAVLRR